MSDVFSNTYADKTRADAYATLAFAGTYLLAFRDLPTIIAKYVQGSQALDFGCGAGRSTRFLRNLGFTVTGVDIAQPMLAQARLSDPQGDYRLLADGDLGQLDAASYDLILAAFPFDNIPTLDTKVALFQGLRRLLKPTGKLINLVSAPEIYWHEWASFSTKDYPQNRLARSGERVHIVMLDVDDRRPVEDILWNDEAYRETYRHAHLQLLALYQPLGRPDEAFSWVSETTVAPWSIYVLAAEE